LRLIGVQPHRCPKRVKRAVQIVQLEQGGGEIGPKSPAFRLQPDRPADAFGGIGGTAVLKREQTP